jgi:hypothetical protein
VKNKTVQENNESREEKKREMERPEKEREGERSARDSRGEKFYLKEKEANEDEQAKR